MIHLYQHRDLGTLADVFATLRAHAVKSSVLAADTVLVPNRGAARWLQARIAEGGGSAANLELPVPGRFVWLVLRDTLPGQPDSSDFERAPLAWHLYSLLPGISVPQVQRYLAAEPRERQRYQLARRLAHVFDQYLIHRRAMLVEWEAGREAGYAPASWQAPVWRAVVERLGGRHRAALMTEFLETAEGGALDSSGLPETVYAFGLSDLPVDYLRLLHALGRYVDVHFLLPNPSTSYWGDVRRVPVAGASGQLDLPLAPARSPAGEEGEHATEGFEPSVTAASDSPGPDFASSELQRDESKIGHPLLASLGRPARDFLGWLYSDEFDRVDEHELAVEGPAGDSLLARIQAGIVAGEIEAEDRGSAAGDVSVQVHACHGPLREIQVLHDRLLDLLGREDALEPRGILVLLPDVARYAPAVHSVFGCAGGGRWIPYSIAEQPRRDTHPIAQTFQQLIELPLWRWTASEVLALAGVPAVMRRFSLDESDLELLHHCVAEAGVRWGLDAATRAHLGSAGFEQNTWRFGLDRLLLGLAQRDAEALVDGVAPWSDLEGGAGAAVGRLWLLLDRLRHWRDVLTEGADAGGWQERLNAMVADLFSVDPDDAAEQTALETVFDATATLEGAADALGDEALSWEAVREALLGALAGPSERQPLITGGVTFCGLEPLRGVPFDVICMVGMDDGVFPRQDGQREFNLIRKQPASGDPSVRDADRMAFLQALAGARRCFYLSYNARSVTDGAAYEPSPVVAEFLDYLHGCHFAGWSYDAFREAVVTGQAMQPFSTRYFRADEPALFTFADDWRAAASAQCGEREAAPSLVDGTRLDEHAATEPVDLGDLQRFFRHPAAWFFRERLRLQLGAPEDALADEEPRGLNSLESHLLRERLFTAAKTQGHQAVDLEPGALARAQGHLPPPPLGAAVHAEAAAAVNAVLPLYWQWRDDDAGAEASEIDLRLDDGTRLLGHVPAVGPHALHRLRPGKLRLKHLLPWWLEYLAVVAGGRAIRLQVAGVDGGALLQRAGSVSPDTARTLLAQALVHFREGQARALLFEPYLSEDYLKHCDKGGGKSPAEALSTLNGWLSRNRYPHQAMEDDWLRPLFDPRPRPLGTDPAASTLVAMTDDIARPLYAHLPEIDAEDEA